MSQPFRFKSFSVAQDRCAMKIGIDGVLLGAWVSLDHSPDSILDIGSGTGLIALQLAQRSNANLIDGIEIDHDAFEQCVQNFEASPWSDRLFCYHASIQEFASEIEESYDLIVCNPPFFKEEVRSNDTQRDIARFEESMPLTHLLICALHLMSAEGKLALVFPAHRADELLDLASEMDLHPSRICWVKGSPKNEPKRIMVEFGMETSEVIHEELCLRREDNSWDPNYVALVDEFYLDIQSSY